MVFDAARLALDYGYTDPEAKETVNLTTPTQMKGLLYTLQNREGEPRYQFIPTWITDALERGLVLLSRYGDGAFELKPELLDCFTQNYGR
jgi:hypothetical protein